jgi:hypothetical protein
VVKSGDSSSQYASTRDKLSYKLKVRNPMELDSRARVHLEWMFENQPELVKELSKNGQLESRLEAKLQQALNLVANLKPEA